MGGKNPISDAGNAINKFGSDTGNRLNRELSNAGNSINEYVEGRTGIKGQGGSKDPLGDASKGNIPAQLNRQNVESIREQQRKLIEEYEKDAGKYKSGFLDVASKDARKQLAENMLQNKRKTYSQGIVRAGLLDLNNAMAQAETKSDLAQKEYDINKNIDDQIAEMKTSYTQSGLDYANLGQQQQINAYKDALERMQRQSAATRDLLTSGGQLAGTLAAQEKTGKKTGHFNV